MKRIANLKTDHFIIWDTSRDAPCTKIMTSQEMERYINSWPQENFDEKMQVRIFLQLLENAKQWGVSTKLIEGTPSEQVQALIENNRAKDWVEAYKWAEDEEDSEMTLEEIIHYWS